MKLMSWNVNGLRAVMKKGFQEFVEDHNPDVLCLQETKAHPEQVDLSPLEEAGYRAIWNSAEKKGYSGTLTLTKRKPVSTLIGMGIDEHDKEGRIVTSEFPSYFVVNVYTPNAQNELVRLPYRQRWDADFLKFLKQLEESKPVILCGDLNVAHEEIDLANPKSNRNTPGFSDEEREGFDKLLEAGFIDTFREFEKGPDHYSWWSYRAGARARNVGWRLDYWCISQALGKKMKSAAIRPDVHGSDHCPVELVLK